MNLALRAGLAFNGARDYYNVFGYPRVLTVELLLAKYERQDLATRVVDMPPESTWAYPPMIGVAKEKDGLRDVSVDTTSEFAKRWIELTQLGQLWPAVLQADKLCAFDSFSIIWLGLPGKADTQAPQIRNPEDILYMTALGAGNVKIKTYEQDTANPRFGQPLMYEVSMDRADGSKFTSAVHWSRVVHVADLPLQGKMFAIPRLARVYNLLEDIFKVAGASAETYWLIANRGMQVDVDKEMSFQKGDEEALSAELDEYQHQLRRYIRTRGVKITNLGSEVADPSGTFDKLLGLLAAATSIPQRILLGAEAGQLASEQDRANWAEYIERRRITYAQPYILLPIVQRLEMLGLVKKGTSKNMVFVWPDAFHQSPLEQAETMSAKARALINISRQSQYGTPYVGRKEARVWLGLSPELAEDDEYPPPPAAKPAKQGGTSASGGSGGNDGSGDSGGGSSVDGGNAPVSGGMGKD